MTQHESATIRDEEQRTPDRPSAAEPQSRLSFFIPDLTLGGAEQVTVTIINGLAKRGYDIELLLSRADGALQSELSEEVEVVELGPPRFPALGVAEHARTLVKHLRRRQPAVLFTHLAHVSVVTLAARTAVDIDTAVVPTHHKSFHTAPDPSLKDRAVRQLVPRFYPKADRVIAVSGGVADSLARHTPVAREDISVLHNPVDVETVRERARTPVDHRWLDDDETDVVLFVGRHENQKDLETWLRAFERVHDEHPTARAIIVGTGSRHEDVRSMAEQRGLDDVVSMPGYVENPYQYMGQADVFLLSSRYEGLPTVLIEALACGCPVVATACPSGPREILDDGEYGPLAPVGDAAALAEGVGTALSDPVDAETLGRRADEFATPAVIDNYERFIHEQIPRR